MPSTYDSELAKKLNLKTGMRARVLAQPAQVDLSGVVTTENPDADGTIAFVRTMEDVDRVTHEVVEAARNGQVTWMVYPKAKQLGSDLNRDVLWKTMRERGVEANRQVSIDDTWSAMRFKSGA
jgi:hypothetical protein